MAGSLGYLFTDNPPDVSYIASQQWFWPAVIIGFLFVSLFQVMAITAQRLGVSKVSIAVKMSVVLPVMAGVFFYHERLTILGWMGVVLALLAVYFGTKKRYAIENNRQLSLLYFLPAILFFGNGSIDVMLKYAQHFWLRANEMALFSGILFAFAFFWGILFALHAIFVKSKLPAIRDLLWGLLLGVPNFGSIYFLLQALDKSNMASAAIYPINNVAIVGLSAVTGVILFKEQLSKLNLFGLFAAIIAILLIAYG